MKSSITDLTSLFDEDYIGAQDANCPWPGTLSSVSCKLGLE